MMSDITNVSEVKLIFICSYQGLALGLSNSFENSLRKGLIIFKNFDFVFVESPTFDIRIDNRLS